MTERPDEPRFATAGGIGDANSADSETDGSARRVDQGVFRDVIGRFASGVAIITTSVGDRDYGTTASALTSLSMEPPMLLICLNRTSDTQAAIVKSDRFVVNILSESQEEIAMRFATKEPSKFADTRIARSEASLPMLADALAHLECRVIDIASGGTHRVFLSDVETAEAREGTPLTYFRGRFGRFEDLLQEAAYRRVRGLVLHPRVAGACRGGD